LKEFPPDKTQQPHPPFCHSASPYPIGKKGVVNVSYILMIKMIINESWRKGNSNRIEKNKFVEEKPPSREKVESLLHLRLKKSMKMIF
jgi:hypothetical protein